MAKSKKVDHQRPMNRRFVQKRFVVAFVSLGIVASMALLALNGIHIPSFGKAPSVPDSDEPVYSFDWPVDYLNGTVTPIVTIHSDFSTYDGTDVAVQGNVTAAPDEYDNGCFFIQDSTGGLMVQTGGSGFTFNLNRGDYVRLYGTVAETVQGMHMIQDAQSYWLMGTGSTVETEHMYNSSLVAASDQGRLIKMNGYLTNFIYDNTSHTTPDWEKISCTSTLWMYGRYFTVQATNITLSDYAGFAMVTGVMFYDGGSYALSPRSVSDIEQGNGPLNSPYPDGDISDWTSSETAILDSDGDSNSPGNEIVCLYVSWDADFFYVALDYIINTGYAAIVYVDAIPNFGADNVSTLPSWPRHLAFMDGDFDADLMICRYEDSTVGIWRILSNAAVIDIAISCMPTASGAADGSGATIEVGIPWNILTGQDPGRVLPGNIIRMGAVITGGDNTNVWDCAPDSLLYTMWYDWAKMYNFYDFCIDCDLDGYPDDYSSGFAIPEFSILIVVPMMVAVMLVVRARRKKT
ncbi:MAG: hypothetical protein KKE24_03740 [Candidatus Thermoplasmatota archaeon]|nr:hypothetical protein [Candidatus Thermoplasmatota archaeon]